MNLLGGVVGSVLVLSKDDACRVGVGLAHLCDAGSNGSCECALLGESQWRISCNALEYLSVAEELYRVGFGCLYTLVGNGESKLA